MDDAPGGAEAVATWVDTASEEWGTPVAESKLESKVRTDFDIVGAGMVEFLTIIRPLQRIIRQHAEIMVDRGVMTDGESVEWINLHWDLLAARADGITGGGAIICYGRERRTRISVGVKHESLAGYTRMRLKAMTFVLARSGAAEDEQDLDDLTVAGVSERRRDRRDTDDLPSVGSSSEDASGHVNTDEAFDDFVATFGSIEVDDPPPRKELAVFSDGGKWVRCEYDAEAYDAISEQLDQKKLAKMGEDAAAVHRERQQSNRAARSAAMADLAAMQAKQESDKEKKEAERQARHEKLQEMARKTLASRRGGAGG